MSYSPSVTCFGLQFSLDSYNHPKSHKFHYKLHASNLWCSTPIISKNLCSFCTMFCQNKLVVPSTITPFNRQPTPISSMQCCYITCNIPTDYWCWLLPIRYRPPTRNKECVGSMQWPHNTFQQPHAGTHPTKIGSLREDVAFIHTHTHTQITNLKFITICLLNSQYFYTRKPQIAIKYLTVCLNIYSVESNRIESARLGSGRLFPLFWEVLCRIHGSFLGKCRQIVV